MKYIREEIMNEIEQKIKEFDKNNKFENYKYNIYIVNLGTIKSWDECGGHKITTDNSGDSYIIEKEEYIKARYITDVKMDIDDYLQRIDEYIFVTDTF